MAGTPFRSTTYPNVYPDYELLRKNCRRLGIPVPKIAKVMNATDTGFNNTGNETHGERKDLLLTYNRVVNNFATPGTGPNPVPTFQMSSNNLTSDVAYIDPLSCPADMTVLGIVTPRGTQAVSHHVLVFGKGDSAGTNKGWNLALNNFLTTTDYFPGFKCYIGGTRYDAYDTTQWVIGERIVMCGMREGLEVKFFRDGKKMATTACPITAQNDANVHLNIFGFSDVGTYNGQMDIELLLLWDSAIPEEIVTILSQDPYQLWADVNDESVHSPSAGVQIYNKTISQVITFFQTLATQGFVFRSITGNTVTRIQGGGRQIVRTAAGVIWHVYYEGGNVKTAYSSDNGTNWTVVTVGATWVPTGMSIAIGAGDAPILALTRASNDDFYIYQWNGTTWVLKKQLNSPSAESESLQILYTGSQYMLVSGYITSTGDRRVYSWTSPNLTTWTAVLIKNGDSSGTGPQKYRRVAACVDTSGYVHAVYSVRSSSVHKLYYRKYSGGAWGTEELIATGYGGNNITDFHTGISIAVDDLGYVHVVCRVRGTLYTGRVRLAYFKRTTVWSAVEYVHSDVDADQDYPSLSLNLRTPVVCWASAGLGLGVVIAKRGSEWVLNTITSNTRDSVQTVHGPSYGSAYNYTRGVVGSMRGSEEYFYSTDIIAGNAASMETTINFTSILSTQRRVLANTINFTSALSAVRAIGLSSVINFSQRLNFARTRAMSGTINFTHHLEGYTGNVQLMRSTINFTSTLTGVKSPTKNLAHTINFVSRLNRVVSSTMTNNIAFSGVVTVNVVKNQVIAQSINFVSAIRYNASLKKFLANTLNFIVGLVAMKGDEGCQPAFTPERPLPTSEDDVAVVYLIGPLPSPTLTVQLKRPEYGNSRRQALQVKANRTRGGKLRVHARTPTYEPQSISFESLSYLKLEQVRNFLRVTKGKKIYYLDEKNRKWIGYITGSDIDLAEEARDRGGQFTLEFEGVLAS